MAFDRTLFVVHTCRLMETMRVMEDEICYRANDCQYILNIVLPSLLQHSSYGSVNFIRYLGQI